MAIDNRYVEVIDRATNFQTEGDCHVRSVKYYRQVKSPPGGSLTETRTDKSTKKSTEKSTEGRPTFY